MNHNYDKLNDVQSDLHKDFYIFKNIKLINQCGRH